MNPAKKILIVDDSQIDLKLESYLVEEIGFSPVVASDGHKAIDILQKESFAVVLIDLTMPRMSGLELLKKIRQMPQHATVPIMVISGKSDSKNVVSAVQLGANDYIVKPIDPSVFINKIDHLIFSDESDWFEYEVGGDTAESSVTIDANLALVSFNELQFTVKSAFQIPVGTNLFIDNAILKRVGADRVGGRVVKCEGEPNNYRVSLTFLGMTEELRKKIRLYCRSLWSGKDRGKSAG